MAQLKPMWRIPDGKVPDFIAFGANMVAHVGSRITCNPPPEDTDDDYLILATSSVHYTLLKQGWSLGGSDFMHTANDKFQSYTKGEVNLIVTHDGLFFSGFVLATKVCTELNLLEKKDRIVLFQAILYGNAP